MHPSSPEPEDEFSPKRELHGKLARKLERYFRGSEIPDWFPSFKLCGQEITAVQWCTNCDAEHRLEHRCSKKWCPLCNFKITADRQARLKIWSREIRNPQHVVLTQKNFEHISAEKFSEHTRNLQHIRRNKVWSRVHGGITSVETTNTGCGWHIHSHSLLDVDFIDEKVLAVEWGKLVAQEFAIVHRKEITSERYEKEVCKYVCKPSEMVKWRGRDICNFIEAIQGKRFFFAFGSMFNERKKVRAIFNSEKMAHEYECKSCEATRCLEFLPESQMSIERKLKFISRKKFGMGN